MAAEKPMGLEDSDRDQSTEQTASEPVRQGDQYRPYCRRHNCLMESQGTKSRVTRYYCPVEGCDSAEKRPQPKSVIPRRPLECPHCAASAGKKAKPVYCEVDYRRSHQGTLLMVCPSDGCDYKVRVPRPDVVVRTHRMHAREADSLERQ